MTNIKTLLQRYKDNTLTLEELIRLRTAINSMTDKELEELISPVVDDFIDDGISVLAKVKQSIDKAIARQRISGFYRTTLRIAAALVGAVLLVGGAFILFDVLRQNTEYRRLADNEVHIATGHGESMLAMLPDGSRIRLGYNSTLHYRVGDFSSSGRAVEFSGEGTFHIVSDTTAPLTVKTDDLLVKVLGTVFSVEARRDRDKSTVYLKEGRVELTLDDKDAKVALAPSEMAVIDRKNGVISVNNSVSAKEAAARLKGEIVFDSRPVGEVLHAMGSCYGVQIRFAETHFEHDIFTGVIPTDNLESALRIIEENYGVAGSREYGEIVLR